MADKTVTIKMAGRIDSNNSAENEQRILAEIDGAEIDTLVIDASELEYISSAGLRVILRLKKTYPDLRITGVSSDVYEILDMTGFTEMMTVEKAYRVVSVDGCEILGRGANGTVYRYNRDTVVKVYHNADALDDIRHEREVAKLALILGIPTSISYDVVKVGDSYGTVFEMLDANSFSKIITNEPEKRDWCVGEYVKMLKTIHGTLVPAGKLPDIRDTVISWARFMVDYLPEGLGKKLVDMVEAVPHDDHMIHGDYHTGNLMLQNDEVLIIDMDTLAVGNPIFELASMYNGFVGFYEVDRELIKRFQGYDYETSKEFWRKALAAYLGTRCEAKIREVEEKARIIGYARLVRRSIRRGGMDTEEGRKQIDFWRGRLIELLEKNDTLLFNPDELEIEAISENLDDVQAFVGERLDAAECPMKAQMQISVAVEEIFVNIASYAYAPDKGSATVRVEVSGDPVTVTITFVDRGVPYDPLAKEDPDVTLSAEERGIGGLGIFMTKKIMDDVAYEYRDGKNILTLKKNI